MTDNPRYFRALLIAPLAVVPIFVVPMLPAMFVELFSGSRSVPNAHEFLAILTVFAMSVAIGAAVSYIATAALGLPAYLILRKYGKASMRSCVSTGGLLGALLGCVFILIPTVMVMTTLCGAAVAAAFCSIAGRQDPARS